jgi:outer membrane protein OmpA-like peptidoglycan-associated protein
MKNIVWLVLLLGFSTTMAQEVQWSYNVIDYSSQKSSNEYAAIQALGMPNVMNPGKKNINAWEPLGNLKEDFIKVGFLVPKLIKQIIISESCHPGFISNVFAYDSLDKEYAISTYTPKAIQSTSRVLLISTEHLKFKVFSIKIVLKGQIDMMTEIDAIGVSSSEKLYKIKKTTNDIIKSNMIATKLDTSVNSIYTEMGPLVSPDGKTLYFSRRGDPRNIGGVDDLEDIWYSTWNPNKKNWNTAQNIGKPLNNIDPNFINSISPDGNTILLGNVYLPDSTEEDGVSTSNRLVNGWTYPNSLSIVGDSVDNNKSEMANYFVSNSQKIMLISSDIKNNSLGSRDIYVSFLRDTLWTKPLNLGKDINTKGVESAPFLASDDKTLYFTSDGLNGYGGSDIFMSRRLDNTWTNWSRPENLGPIVNTAHDESYLTLSASGNKVFFTSQVKKSLDVDMYMLELPKILKPSPVMLMSGRVINSKTNEIVPDVKIVFENLDTGVEIGFAKSNPITGQYEIVLPSGSEYAYLAQKKGFISVHAHIDLKEMTEYKEYDKDLYITPIEVGQVVVLNNIFFDFDKSELKKSSFPELDRLCKLLMTSKAIKIEVSAHADNVGTEIYNDILTIKRATSVINYLLAKSGIDINRIVMKHYGETNPIASNKTAKGRKLNRRVEFKILEK